MLLVKYFLSAVAATTALAAPLLDRRDFAYGSTPVRGANIGGWLVLEPWITPSLFDKLGGAAIDEYTFCQNNPNAQADLQAHWSSWATQGDFAKLAQSGFNLVRIPIGYWAYQKYQNDPYIQGADAYLEQAIGWARATGLKVWIDLHGAPLSQNGFDNSGQKMSNPQWTTSDSVQATVQVIGQIAAKYATGAYDDVIVGIQLLNEPLMGNLPGGKDATASYYQQAFNVVRQSGQTPVVFHDGFDKPSNWNGFLTGPGSSGALVDHHEYQVFTNELVSLSYADHASYVWESASSWATGQDKWLFCGEWTAAMTDCATYLNGYGIGARYDGTYQGSSYVGSCAGKSDISSWDGDLRSATTNYISAQIKAYESYTQGWVFWNFKTEGSGEWDLFALLDNGIWPGM